MSGNRRSPRQAIAIVQRPVHHRWAGELVRQVLLDVAGAAVAVDGATVFCVRAADGAAGELQAGVNLLSAPAGSIKPITWWVIERLRSIAFERIVLVAADTLGLTPRLLATALSASSRITRIGGRGTGGVLYLVSGADLAIGAPPWVAALEGLPLPLRDQRTITWIDAVPSLAGLTTAAELHEVVEDAERARWLPRTAAWLAAGGEPVGGADADGAGAPHPEPSR